MVLVVVMFFAAVLLEGKDKGFRLLPETSEGVADTRTVGRWFRRAFDVSLDTHQSLREAVIEWCEPRPIEELYRSGLSPPERLLRRPWRSRKDAARTWRNLVLLSSARRDLEVPIAQLLARAHTIANINHRQFLL